MKLATRLRLNITLLIAFLVLIGITAAVTYRHVERSFRESAFVDRIVGDAFDLNTLTLDFLLNKTERARQQWLTQHRSMADLWEDATFSSRNEQVLFEKIVRNHRDLMALFPLIADRLGSAPGSRPTDDALETAFISRFSSQILLKTRVIVSAAERLNDMRREQVVGDLKMAAWLMGAVGGTCLLLGLLISAGIQRRIIVPLVRLHRGAIQIREGNWGFRTGIRGTGEVRELSEAFDDMVSTLEKTTVSRDRLLEEIDRHRKTLSALKASEEKFRSITAAAQDAIILMNDQGRISYWNEAAEAIFGYPSDEAVGRDLHEMIVPAGHHDVYWDGMVEFVQSGTGPAIGRTIELTALRKGGVEFPVEVSLSAVRLDGRWTAVGFVRDVTEKKRTEARLRQSEKMESIGHLAGGIAHDFNNILYAIMGYTELTLDHIQKGSVEESNLQEVYAAALRAKHLVRQILTFARKGDDRVQPVRIDIIAKEALKMMRSTLPTSIDIRQEIDRCSPVMADPTQIHQVVMNLCTNAFHAMEEEGGTLAVGLEDVFLEGSDVRHFTGLEPGHYVNLSVSDGGRGIPPEIMGSIFDPYFTTKETGKGTGMGLAVVHGIVRSSGGDIAVKSTPAKGSRFDIYLPMARKAAEIEQVPSRSTTTGGNERILLVDDEPAIATMLSQMLARLGYSVTAHNRSDEALSQFQAFPEGFDLVITDMAMPAMTGEKLASEIIRIRPDVPVILCTGHSERISEEGAREIGISAFVMKPVAKRELAEAVRKALDTAGAEG